MVGRTTSSQSAGDGASQYSAGEMVVVHNSYVNNEEVKELARREGREVVRNSLPEIAAAAANVLMERGDRFVDMVLDKVAARDSGLFGRFSDPRIQVALMLAQREYAESDDDHLGHLLANVVTDMMSESIRTHDELLLRQCLKIAPTLSGPELATLAVIGLLRDVWYPPISDPITLLHALDATFSPYYDCIVSDFRELSYMESVGVCTQAQLLPDVLGGVYNAYTIVIGANPQASYVPFALDDLPPEVEQADIDRRLRSSRDGFSIAADVERDGKYVMRPELRDEILSAKEAANYGWMKPKSERPQADHLALFVSKRLLKESEVERIADEYYPALAKFFGDLTGVGVLRFVTTVTGMKLAEQEAIVRNPDAPTILSRYFERPTEVGMSQSATPTPEAG